MSNALYCSVCGKEVPSAAAKCSHCSAPILTRLVGGAFLFLGVGFCLLGLGAFKVLSSSGPLSGALFPGIFGGTACIAGWGALGKARTLSQKHGRTLSQMLAREKQGAMPGDEVMVRPSEFSATETSSGRGTDRASLASKLLLAVGALGFVWGLSSLLMGPSGPVFVERSHNWMTLGFVLFALGTIVAWVAGKKATAGSLGWCLGVMGILFFCFSGFPRGCAAVAPAPGAPVPATLPGGLHKFVVRVKGHCSFSGSLMVVAGGQSSQRTVQGEPDIDKPVEFTEVANLVSLSFQMRDKYGRLEVEIERDGVIVQHEVTDADFGVVTLATK